MKLFEKKITQLWIKSVERFSMLGNTNIYHTLIVLEILLK